jgi:beta-phosphoglucomutase-like phosphatase (HAD superfamily)
MPPSSATPPTKLPGPFKGVVFDLDGLLVQTNKQWFRAKRMLFERRGMELTDEDLSAVFGAAEMESARYFAGRFGLRDDEVPALRDEYLDIVIEGIDLGIDIKEGAAELVEHLAGTVPIAVASNTRRAIVERVLAQTPFGDRFDAVNTGDEVTPKPAPDIYLLACRRLGVEPSAAVALEDSPTGVRAAKAAGMHCVGVPSHDGHPLEMADDVVPSLARLL